MQVAECISLYGVPLFSKAIVNTRPDSAMSRVGNDNDDYYDYEGADDLEGLQDGYGNTVFLRNLTDEIDIALGLADTDRDVAPTDVLYIIKWKILDLANEFIKYNRRVYVAYAKTVAVYQYALSLFDGDGFGRGFGRRLPPLDDYSEDDDEEPVQYSTDDEEMSVTASEAKRMHILHF